MAKYDFGNIADVKIESKSKNFEVNLDSNRMRGQITENMFISGAFVDKGARKYVPYATGATLRSMKIKRGSSGVELSSYNYKLKSGGTRYNLKGAPKKTYKTKSGRIVRAGENSDKYKWYDRFAKENEKELVDLMMKGVIQQ